MDYARGGAVEKLQEAGRHRESPVLMDISRTSTRGPAVGSILSFDEGPAGKKRRYRLEMRMDCPSQVAKSYEDAIERRKVKGREEATGMGRK